MNSGYGRLGDNFVSVDYLNPGGSETHVDSAYVRLRRQHFEEKERGEAYT